MTCAPISKPEDHPLPLLLFIHVSEASQDGGSQKSDKSPWPLRPFIHKETVPPLLPFFPLPFLPLF